MSAAVDERTFSEVKRLCFNDLCCGSPLSKSANELALGADPADTVCPLASTVAYIWMLTS